MGEQDNTKKDSKQDKPHPDDKAGVGLPNGKFHIRPIISLVLIAIAEVGIILWQLYEKLLPRFPIIANAGLLFSMFCMGAYGVHNVIKSEDFQKIYSRYSKKVWGTYAAFCLILAFFFIGASWPNPEQKPNFIWSLQIDDDENSLLLLTNACLFSWGLEKTSDLPHGASMVNTRISGAILIPVAENESNKVLRLILDNHAEITIKDPAIMVGFPKEWRVGFDSAKWEEIDGGMVVYRNDEPVAKILPQKMRYLSIVKRVIIGPFDIGQLPPITNFSPIEYENNSIKAGLISISLRTSEFHSWEFSAVLNANVFFMPAQTNFSKPIVTCFKIASNGQLIPPTDKELEELQK